VKFVAKMQMRKNTYKCALMRYYSRVRKVTLLLAEPAFERFDSYCSSRGFKKSPLVARLVREHLDRESFYVQGELDLRPVLRGNSTRKGRRRGLRAR